MNNSKRLAKYLLIMAFPLLGIGVAQATGVSYLGQVPTGNYAQVKSIVSQTCSACHGAHGNSLMPIYPNLAGQNASYIIKQLNDFHSGARTNAIMQAMVATIPPNEFSSDVQDLAFYFSQQPFNPKANANASAPKATLAVLKLGETIYRSGLPKSGVPACMACHEANGMGNGPMAIPRLAGQHSSYVITQLKQFRDHDRHNDPHKMMQMIAGHLNKKQMTAVADYVQALRPRMILGSGPKNLVQLERLDNPVVGVPASQIAVSTAKASKPPAASAP